MSQSNSKRATQVAFVHPDLGIGGAERLVCDAALALQSKGHTVKIFTAHHDVTHCFKETADGTLEVISVGDWLPRHILWKFYAFFAYLRMVYVALYLVLVSDFKPSVVICDQVSACIPVLRLSSSWKIVFYCHFPDMLLTQRTNFLKKLYRAPLDWLEERTTGMADLIFVNSKFTASTFYNTFTSLASLQPSVLYPTLNLDAFVQLSNAEQLLREVVDTPKKYLFVSINRFERKKNLNLALRALQSLRNKCTPDQWKQVHLLMAGGYDPRNEENIHHFAELEALALELDVSTHVTFVRSFSDEQKLCFLQTALGLLYTPSNEHFGIVPIEAMYMQCPVIAVNNGGPTETVVHKSTGYLCPASPNDFSEAMLELIDTEGLRTTMGTNGRTRVLDKFSFQAFATRLDEELWTLLSYVGGVHSSTGVAPAGADAAGVAPAHWLNRFQLFALLSLTSLVIVVVTFATSVGRVVGRMVGL